MEKYCWLGGLPAFRNCNKVLDAEGELATAECQQELQSAGHYVQVAGNKRKVGQPYIKLPVIQTQTVMQAVTGS